MLKGKTIIEFTDVNTGEKEIIEENNMITNAINDLFNTFPNLINPNAIYKGSYFYGVNFQKLYEFLLGGLLLFDGQLEENKDNLYAPSKMNLIGCGVYSKQNDSENEKKGNYNQAESEYNEEQKYIKFVYDFSTSQANGTISSVALTSFIGGHTSYGGNNVEKVKKSNGALDYTYNFCMKPFYYASNYTTSSSEINAIIPRDITYDKDYTKAIANKEYSVLVGDFTFHQSNTYSLGEIYYGEYPIFVDIDEDAVYYLKTKNFKKFWITKRKAYFKSISVFDFPMAKGDLISEYELNELSTNNLKTYYGGRCYRFDTATRCLYIFYITQNRAVSPYVNNNEEIKGVKIDLSNVESITLQEISIRNMTGKTLDFNNKKKLFVNNGFLYAVIYSDNEYEKQDIYKIEIANPANVTKIAYKYEEEKYDKLRGYPVYELNGILYLQNGNIIKNDEVLKTEMTCFAYFDNEQAINDLYAIPFMKNKKPSNFVYVYNGYPRPTNTPSDKSLQLTTMIGGICFLNNYLATINNLSQPVTKTADKTMKVTYIIQETESTSI